MVLEGKTKHQRHSAPGWTTITLLNNHDHDTQRTSTVKPANPLPFSPNSARGTRGKTGNTTITHRTLTPQGER